MTDLRTTCPKCGKDIYKYYHFVDSCNMGVQLPCGEYKVKCCAGYLMEDKPYCGHEFMVNVGQTVEVVK